MYNLLVLLLLLTAVQGVSAQERRRSPDGGGPTLPYVAGTENFPLSGSWVGTMNRVGVGSFPFAFNIETDGRMYRNFASSMGGQVTTHQNWKATSKTVRWQVESGAAVLVYTAQLISADSITGTIERRDGKPGAAGTSQGSFTLVRAKPPMERVRND